MGILEEQVDQFVFTHDVTTVHGLDIGGGTPTALEDPDLERLLCISDRLVET